MAIPAYIDNDRAGQRGQARAQPLTDLSAGINAMQRAAFALNNWVATTSTTSNSSTVATAATSPPSLTTASVTGAPPTRSSTWVASVISAA